MRSTTSSTKPPTISVHADDPGVEQHVLDEAVQQRRRSRPPAGRRSSTPMTKRRASGSCGRRLGDATRAGRNRPTRIARIAPSWIRTSKVLPVDSKPRKWPTSSRWPGRGDRQELGQALDEAEEERLEQFASSLNILEDGGPMPPRSACSRPSREAFALRGATAVLRRAHGIHRDPYHPLTRARPYSRRLLRV